MVVLTEAVQLNGLHVKACHPLQYLKSSTYYIDQTEVAGNSIGNPKSNFKEKAHKNKTVKEALQNHFFSFLKFDTNQMDNFTIWK